jgi:hypothetical protein
MTISYPDEESPDFDRAADETVELGNRLLQQDEEADQWDVAAGLLAGAVHFWLYTHQPCGDPSCEACREVDTAAKRLRKLLAEVSKSAEESEYYHSPNDANAGRA